MTDETQPAVLLSAVVQPKAQAESEHPPPLPPIPVDIDKIYTKDELLLHDKDGDLWLAIDGTVYDLTKFSEEHPGGKKILLSVAGTDASKKFRKYHGDNVLQRYAKEYKIGRLRIEVQEKGSKGLFSWFRRKK
ncbi:cytochrome b5-like heme/steroid binding domain-containing protein [Aspergillus egyptiacus]|nr:cytochrome b5-like heme/steroid binding domain-containing protein [Aspergillus egyptiacus]